MNFTVRIKTEGDSFIFKQSRPYVEKYPQIPAPEHRVSMESRFYQFVSHKKGVSDQMPEIIHADSEQDVLIMQDLGELSSFEKIYVGDKIATEEIDQLINWLKTLHSLSFTDAERVRLENREMRILNHEHIFSLPLRKNNGVDLDAITPGLRHQAEQLKNDQGFVERVEETGEWYLQNGRYLLHGDYYPASWLQKDGKIFIIDTEFAFFGSKEFDYGIMWAHLILSGQATAVIDHFLSACGGLNLDVLARYAGVEIMRRLIGVAQLPIQLSLKQKKNLLEHSKMLVLK